MDILSDVENVDIMIGSYSRDDERKDHSEREVNMDSGSIRPQQNSNLVKKDFGSLLNTNSRENSELINETTKMISEEMSNQMSRKLNEIKSNLYSQIQDAIITAVVEKVLPSIQSTLDTEGRGNFTAVDRSPVGYNGAPKFIMLRERWKISPKRFSNEKL